MLERKSCYWCNENSVLVMQERNCTFYFKFESLKTLCIDLGCTFLDVGSNAKYLSNRIIGEWLGVMAEIIGHDILEKVRASPEVGLMADESTDISVTKELIVYARTLYGREVFFFFLLKHSYR